MTNASEIWDIFEAYQNFDEYIVPTSTEGRRTLISISCGIYNKYMSGEDDVRIMFDKETDMLNTTLDDARLEILAKCMMLKLAQDVYVEMAENYNQNQTTMGFKDYKSSTGAKMDYIIMLQNDIKEIKFSISETTAY